MPVLFPLEKDVWEYVKPRLVKRGWWWQRIEAKQPLGVPDVLGMRGRRTVWIEQKRGAVRVSALSADQQRWLRDAKDRDAEVYIVFGTDTGLRWFDDPALLSEIAAPDFFVD